MGLAHIIFIYDDELRKAKSDDRLRVTLASDLGASILKLCLDQDFNKCEDDKSGIRSAPLGHHVNCINVVDEVHSTDEGLYLWAGNCLRSISNLDTGRLESVQKLLDEELCNRKNK